MLWRSLFEPKSSFGSWNYLTGKKIKSKLKFKQKPKTRISRWKSCGCDNPTFCWLLLYILTIHQYIKSWDWECADFGNWYVSSNPPPPEKKINLEKRTQKMNSVKMINYTVIKVHHSQMVKDWVLRILFVEALSNH